MRVLRRSHSDILINDCNNGRMSIRRGRRRADSHEEHPSTASTWSVPFDAGSMDSTMTVDKPIKKTRGGQKPKKVTKHVRFNMGATVKHPCNYFDARQQGSTRKAIQAMWYTSADYRTFKAEAANVARDIRDVASLGTWDDEAPPVALVFLKTLDTWRADPENALKHMSPPDRKAMVLDQAMEIMQSGYLMTTDVDQDTPFALGLERVGCTPWMDYRKQHRDLLFNVIGNIQHNFQSDRARGHAIRRASERMTFTSRAMAMCLGQAIALTVVTEQ